MIFAGIDISERRGQTVALLDGDTRAVRVSTAQTVADAAALLVSAGASVVGVDSPLQPSLMLLRQEEHRVRYNVPDRQGLTGPVYANYRVCDYELIRRGMPLYQVPATEADAPGWMRAGFALGALLRGHGYRLPVHAEDHAATLIEVFPDAAFVTLLGARPVKKSGRTGASGRAQRREVLSRAGLALPESASHDELDACAAAVTAHAWAAGRACALGDPTEGLIILPVPRAALLERYRPESR